MTATTDSVKTKAAERIPTLRNDIPHRVRLSSGVPGNTIESLEETLQTMAEQLPFGATVLIEFDIQITSDRVIVVTHDPTYLNINEEEVTIGNVY